MINTIDDAHFESFVSSNQITIVDFWAEWCAPCKLIAPVLEEVASLYKDSISIAKINVDHNNLTSVQYEVRSIPSLLFFKNGEFLGRTVGAVSKQLVIDKLEHFQVL